MAINVSVQNNDELLPHITILLTQGHYHRGRGVLSLQPMNNNNFKHVVV